MILPRIAMRISTLNRNSKTGSLTIQISRFHRPLLSSPRWDRCRWITYSRYLQQKDADDSSNTESSPDPNSGSRPASINTSTFRNRSSIDDDRYPTSTWTNPFLLSSSSSSIPYTSPTPERSAPRTLNFEKQKYIQLLQSEGLTNQQAEGLVSLIEEAVSESISSVSRSLVAKPDHAETMKRSSDDIKSLHYDIQLLEKKDFVALRKDLERITLEVQRIKSTLVDDLSRVHGGVRLDINLEKARIKDEAQDLDNLVKQAEDRIQNEINELTERIKLIRKSTRQFLTQLVGILAIAVAIFKYSSVPNTTSPTSTVAP